MTKNASLLTILFLFYIGIRAQQLLTPSIGFSHKKTSYITLIDGTEITGSIKDIDRKKGLIEFIKIKDGAGKKHKLKPEQIKFMYLTPSGLDKYNKLTSFIYDAQKWTDQKLDQDFLNKGYVYFELADVKIKKKNRKFLMQLLNPSFSKYIKVYDDPLAKETMSFGVGSFDLIGGNAKSYYVSKGGSPAFRLKKKNYKKEFIPLWNSCDEVINGFPNQKWNDLVMHIITFSECKR